MPIPCKNIKDKVFRTVKFRILDDDIDQLLFVKIARYDYSQK